MLRTILKELRNFSDVRVTVMLAENPDYDSSRLGDVDIIHYCRTESDFSHLAARFDALVVGGGALLDDTVPQQTWQHFKALAIIVVKLPIYFKVRGKKVVLIGLSTNRGLVDKNYTRLLSSTIGQADYFSVRDRYSLNALKNAGCYTEGKTRLTDDIVLANEEISSFAGTSLLAGGKTGSHTEIGIVWVNFENLKPLLRETICEITSALAINGKTARIRLIPFYDFSHADISYYKKVVEMLPAETAANVTIADYCAEIEPILEKFQSCDAVVCLRYHAALLCGALGIPQVVVELAGHPHYRNKMQWVADNFPDSAILLDTTASAEEIANKLHAAICRGRCKPISPNRIAVNREELDRALATALGMEYKPFGGTTQ